MGGRAGGFAPLGVGTGVGTGATDASTFTPASVTVAPASFFTPGTFGTGTGTGAVVSSGGGTGAAVSAAGAVALAVAVTAAAASSPASAAFLFHGILSHATVEAKKANEANKGNAVVKPEDRNRMGGHCTIS